MATSVDPLKIRRKLGRGSWTIPAKFGDDGWAFKRLRNNHYDQASSIIVSVAEFDGAEWIHASISNMDSMPTYYDLKLLHSAVFDNGYAYQVFVPEDEHINIHSYALHLWGRLDGKPELPNFGALGSI